ncbi:zinc finger rna binding protein [Echinococcus multilocularis]|uniref:Zinc finger rna binding protein n=1 Tax=Echinococcus multilocularis TaxID=6211 RepID=A0A0S4MNT9_ECHMU|nr:zinc finger rna binding protein [Echinococcus multilocularis]
MRCFIRDSHPLSWGRSPDYISVVPLDRPAYMDLAPPDVYHGAPARLRMGPLLLRLLECFSTGALIATVVMDRIRLPGRRLDSNDWKIDEPKDLCKWCGRGELSKWRTDNRMEEHKVAILIRNSIISYCGQQRSGGVTFKDVVTQVCLLDATLGEFNEQGVRRSFVCALDMSEKSCPCGISSLFYPTGQRRLSELCVFAIREDNSRRINAYHPVMAFSGTTPNHSHILLQ